MESQAIGRHAILVVHGELDLYSAPRLRTEVLAAAQQRGSGRVVVDLTDVPFVDSSGLGAIVACLEHLREVGGSLTLVTPDGSNVAKLLSMTGLDRAIGTHPTVQEATA